MGALAGPHIWSRHWHLKYFRLQETAVLGWPCRPPQCRMSVYRAGGQTSHGRTSPGDERTTLKCHVQTPCMGIQMGRKRQKKQFASEDGPMLNSVLVDKQRY